MAVKKVSDVAKNAGLIVEEVIKTFQASGVKVTNGNDNVTEDDIVAAGFDKRGQLDKRQEMLQKARERFKKGVKSKEVIVNNKGGSGQGGPSIKISKEELEQRKKRLDQQVHKVDKEREEYNKERAEHASNNEKPAEKQAVKPQNQHAEQKNNAVKEQPQVQNTAKPKENAQPKQDNKPAPKNNDRPKEQRNDDRKDKPFNKDKNKQGDKGKFNKDRNDKGDKQGFKDKDKRFSQDKDKPSCRRKILYKDYRNGRHAYFYPFPYHIPISFWDIRTSW